MERDESLIDGIDVSEVDPELGEMLSIVQESHKVSQPVMAAEPAVEPELRGNPVEGGIEDDEFDQTLGKPDELLKQVEPGALPWAPTQVTDSGE